MQSEVSEISPIQVEIKVQVPWDRVKKSLDQNFARLAKTAKVRGFRPGTVPRHVLKKLYGQAVTAQVPGPRLQAAPFAALRHYQLPGVHQPDVPPAPTHD